MGCVQNHRDCTPLNFCVAQPKSAIKNQHSDKDEEIRHHQRSSSATASICLVTLMMPSTFVAIEEIHPWLTYVYNLQFDQVEVVNKWYLCGKCVMRKLCTRQVVLGVLHVPQCHVHMLEVHTTFKFSGLQQLLIALVFSLSI
jgi:hypothetical protein